VLAGLEDLRAGHLTEEALLVLAAGARLGALGYGIPTASVEDPEGALYELIRARVGGARAHGTYNALRRRMVSFLRASSHAATR